MVPDDIINIITKKLKGKASVEELQQLQQWLEAAPGNQKEYEELAMIWEESIRLTDQQSFHTEAVRSPAELAEEQPVPVQPAGHKFRRYRKPLIWAAVFLVVILAGLYLWNRFHGCAPWAYLC